MSTFTEDEYEEALAIERHTFRTAAKWIALYLGSILGFTMCTAFMAALCEWLFGK